LSRSFIRRRRSDATTIPPCVLVIAGCLRSRLGRAAAGAGSGWLCTTGAGASLGTLVMKLTFSRTVERRRAARSAS